MGSKPESCPELPLGNSLFPVLNDNPEHNEMKTRMTSIGEGLVEDISAFCNQNAIEERYFLATAWAAILSRFTDSEAVHFGIFDDKTETGGQRRDEMGINTHVYEKRQMQLATALVRKEVTVNRLLYADTWSLRNTSPSMYGMFNTGIALTRGQKTPDIAGVVENSENENETCDIMLVLQLAPDHEALWLWYRTSILSESYAIYLTAVIQQAVLAIMQDTYQFMSGLDLISPLEREQIARWNDYTLTTRKESIMDSIFENPARRPDSPAVHAWDGICTITDLKQLVYQLSRKLKNMGVEPGVMIPLCFEKSKWAIAAMLAILQTGAGIIPIDPSMPGERLKTIIAQIKPNVAITSVSKANRLSRLVQNVVTVPAEPDGYDQPTSDEKSEKTTYVSDDHPAYCFFTSGSTGTPKGCIISYHALENIHNHTQRLKMHQGSRALQFANFAFTISLYEIYGTLFAGGTVCIPSDEDRLSNLVGAMNDLEVNWAVLTPTTIRLLQPSDVPLLETLVFGGEPIQDDLIEKWMKSVALIQSYGMTETTGICSLSDPLQSVRERRFVGKPMNAKFWLARDDDDTKLAHIGAVAELVVEGPCLANGYLNLPQRTKESFIEKPPWMVGSHKSDSKKMYKTGDLVRYTSDGTITYIGRKDRQIKIRGQRFEPEEVEIQLAQNLPCCKKVIVEAIQPAGGTGRTMLCAFLQMETSQEEVGELAHWIAKKSDELQIHLRKADIVIRLKLPSYMVPQLFVPITKAPITWSGKTDRQQLRARLSTLNFQELHSRFGLSAVNTKSREISMEQERIVQDIWSQVLRIDQKSIGADDDFFNLGGDSVAAMRVAALVRTNGFAITMTDIFQHSKLSGFSSLLLTRAIDSQAKSCTRFSLLDKDASRLWTSLKQDGVSTTHEDVEDILPVTGQQMFFFNQWTIPCFPFRINGSVDIGRLQDACRAVIKKHSILRSLFWQETESGKVMQVIMRHIELPFRELSTDGELESAARELANNALILPPVSTSIPLQFTLISKSPNEHAFLIRLSHSQMDGFSFPNLFRDLSKAYNEGLSSLPAVPGFSDYVYFCKQEQARKYALKFWVEYLRNSTISQPNWSLTNIPVPEDVVTSTTCQIKTIPPGVTLSTTINSAFSILLSQTINQSDLVFGLVMSTRGNPVPGIETILGPCSNINPIRVHLYPSWTGIELCQSLQEQYLRISQYDWLDWDDDIANRCFGSQPNTKLGYIISHVAPEIADLPLQLNGTHCYQMPPSVNIDVKDQVMIRCLRVGDTLEAQVRTSTAVMSWERASAFGKRLLQLVELLSSEPSRNIGSDYYDLSFQEDAY